MLAACYRRLYCHVAICIAVLALPSAWAADAESRAFDAADKSLRDGFHERAEQAFGEFVAKHPDSPRVPQALLRESQAALAQKKFPAALALLSTNLARAGALEDQFQFGIAQTYFESGAFDAAATNFAVLVSTYTNSTRRLEATLNEAQARFALREWLRVTELLQSPGGLFQQEAARAPASEPVINGRLLLAEALLEQKDFVAAEQVADAILEESLPAKTKWRREYLRARAQFAAQKLEIALAGTSNLVGIALAARLPALEAASVAMQGEILEALNRPDAALAAYAQNQRAGLPPERVREALFKTVELTLAQGQITNALAKLQSFLAEHPNEAGSDIALLTLAELRLKQHQLATDAANSITTNAPVTGTNFLGEAIESCDRLLREFTNSPFAGKAHFVRGWAWLAQGKPAESLAAFQAATKALPWSEAQAAAWFKTADLEFQSREITNALRAYRRVIADYESLPRVQAELVPRARYQMLQASRVAGDRAGADEAMRAVARNYPGNGYAERTMLLFGQAVDEMGDPAAARNTFSNFSVSYPNSPLRPEAELAIARTFERERNWPGAIAQYDAWVGAFPTNDNLPAAEFQRALANSLGGRDTNAFALFTNFITRFPANPLAAHAQNWVGDYYYGATNFTAAERNYQLVYQNTNWPAGLLGDQAKLKAGRAALMRSSFGNAVEYFTNIIEDSRSPASVVVLAYFAYGDALLLQPSTSAQEKFSGALTIYEQVPIRYPNDPLVSRAWGQMGLCYFQLAGADGLSAVKVQEYYARALESYGKVTNAPSVEAAVRQQAEVGLGHVLWQQAKLAQTRGATNEAAALMNAALENYLNVVYANRAGETSEPLWVKEAALSAASVAEARREWDSALKLYLGLGEMIPSLRSNPALEKKIKTAREQIELRKE